jgi:hypothetical protein
MNKQIIFNFIKVLIFTLTVVGYRVIPGTASQIVFAVALALYVLELKWRNKK